MTIEELYHIIQKENLNTNRFTIVDEKKIVMRADC